MNKPLIMIIDDDAALRKTLSDILTLKGYRTCAAGDGAEALVLLRAQDAKVALVDLDLPDVSGIDVLSRVRMERPGMDAIILTGNATLDSAIEATNRGAFSYLQKPYDIEQLLLQLERALEKQRTEERVARHNAELERANARLKILQELSLAINRTIDMDFLLPEVVRVLAQAEVFPFDMQGAIFLAERERLRLASFTSLADKVVSPCKDVCARECLCGLSAETGEIVVCSNSHKDTRHRCNPALPPHGHIIVPLREADRIVGVLCLYTPPDVRFTEEMTGLLSCIGNQIGVGIVNTILYEETKFSSLHDPLTKLANRRLMDLQLHKLIESARRYQRCLAVILLDIDHFKKYNDTWGHVEGDRLLARVGELLLKETRNADYVFRYGGEEFLLVLPEASLPMACEVAERLRKTLETKTGVTVSLGVAEYRKTMPDKESLVSSADQALYRAKEKGRNRVEWAPD